MIILALFLLPILAAVAAYLMRSSAARNFAAAVALADLLLASVLALVGAQNNAYLNIPWAPALGLSFEMRVDALNLFLIWLAPLVTCLALVATPKQTERPAEYSGHMLLMLGALQGLFLAQNLGLFYVFWELMLIPALLLTARWGGSQGPRVALKFFLYTMAGSLPMLLGILYLAAQQSQPNLAFSALRGQSVEVQMAIFWLFFVALAVKVPLVPLHGWQVELYRTTPAAVTAVIAAVMSKAGVYGFLRLGYEIMPEAMAANAQAVSILALITLLYGAICALGERTIRGILAYSSLSHLAMMVLGVFALNVAGRDGAILQMLNHGICTGGLFLLLACLQARHQSDRLDEVSGLAVGAPTLASLFLFLAMASLGLPGLCSFAGEITILTGVFAAQPPRGALASLAVIAAAWYTLRLFQGALWGPPAKTGAVADLERREFVALLPLVVLSAVLGWTPGLWMNLARSFGWN